MGEEKREVGLNNFVPTDWVDGECKSVWLTAYRSILSVNTAQAVRVIDIPPARAILVSGSLSYRAVNIQGGLLDGRIKVRPEMRWTPRGVYLLMMAPYDTANGPGDERRVREIIAASAGLLSAINGGGLTFEFVFDNIVELESGRSSGFSSAAKTPMSFGKPRVSPKDFEITRKAADSLAHLDNGVRARIQLALHWHHESVTTDDPRNEFIALWIALEALGMPDTTNVKPINTLLAQVYEMSVTEVAKKFRLGQLQGFRSRILHKGALLPVHGDLVNFARALFADVLLAVLGLPFQGRAEEFMNQPRFAGKFDLDKLLNPR